MSQTLHFEGLACEKHNENFSYKKYVGLLKKMIDISNVL